MSVGSQILEFLAVEIANAGTQWSLGSFGAIAEFMRDADEAVTFTRGDTFLDVVTGRGGIRIEPTADLRPFAFETITQDSWSGRIALCLPEERCAMNRRAVLTEIGTDADALRDADRGAVLFDLGIAAVQTDALIRVSDTKFVERLRALAGRALLEPGNPAMAAILEASPHRVFVGRIGRIEVFQPIPLANGRSPDGPHTHVLPDLLRHRRTHAATEPIPAGWVPCAHLYPAHPARDAVGNSRPFDPTRHEAFQVLLRMFGDPESIALKQRVVAAIFAGENPSAIAVSESRFARTDICVALRQLKAARGDSPSLAAWSAAHERRTSRGAGGEFSPHHR